MKSLAPLKERLKSSIHKEFLEIRKKAGANKHLELLVPSLLDWMEKGYRFQLKTKELLLIKR